MSNTDFIPLSEEQFDFDVSLSPSSGKEDEDEVFLGPISHKERCISVGIEAHMRTDTSSGPSLGEEPSWSPLKGDTFVEIFKEAHLLAQRIEQSSCSMQDTRDDCAVTTGEDKVPFKEAFVEESSGKLKACGKVLAPSLSPIKRETFCVQDSPMKQLPPAIQQRLLKASITSSPGKGHSSTSSPVKVGKTQPKNTLRCKAALSGTKVLPNRASGPPVTQQSTRIRAPPPQEKSKLPPPEKPKAEKPSYCRKPLGNSCSTEDLHSDTASVASDMSDGSLNASLTGRRGIPAPRKSGLQRPGAMKPPPVHNRRTIERRNTSSSSSSVSSMNSSLSISPTGKGKFNTSLNSSITAVKSKMPGSVSRLSAGITSAKTRTVTTMNKAPETAHGKSTPVKKPEPRPLYQTPKRPLERASSVPSVPDATSIASNTARGPLKAKAVTALTPTSHAKGLQRLQFPSPDAPAAMKSKRLMSARSVESLSQKPLVPAPEQFRTPSGRSSSVSVQPKTRHSSVLPVGRRLSGIPMLTPKTSSRLVQPSQVADKSSLPTPAKNTTQGSPALKVSQQANALESETPPNEELSSSVALQPRSLVFSLESETDEAPTVLLEAGPEEVPQPVAEYIAKDENPTVLNPQEQKIVSVEQTNKVSTLVENEVLLVGVPALVLKPEEKPLIDLSNTPNLIKTAPGKGFGTQLIDLSSPLITWSPTDKKENDQDVAPLIDLSF